MTARSRAKFERFSESGRKAANLPTNPRAAGDAMGMKLQWRILRSELPSHLKPLALVLALIAKDDGTSIWVRVERLAEFLSLHPTTVSRQLKELLALGILVTERRSGRRRATQRRLVAAALPETHSASATQSTGVLHSAKATDSNAGVAPALGNGRDDIAPALAIKPVTAKSPTKNINPSVRPPDVAQTATRVSWFADLLGTAKEADVVVDAVAVEEDEW